jgi:hypothetical protein
MLPAHFLSGFSVDVEVQYLIGLTAESYDNASVGQLQPYAGLRQEHHF